ncbi:MAG: hypothetical protein MUF27_16625 [Acidobacteria bacterium]|jgi:hypothetical protein|nr:hypothetical protein [Acidobacteriota bacterium]
MLTSRTRSFLVTLGIIALFGAADSQATAVKDIIVNAVDPGHANTTIVRWFDELTPEQQVAFDSSFNAGDGYYIAPTATVTWTENGTLYVKTTTIFIVPLNGGQTVVPMAVTCTHSGCTGECTTSGCNKGTDSNGKPECSGVSCKNGVVTCSQNPNCSKTESTAASAFLLFGTI